MTNPHGKTRINRTKTENVMKEVTIVRYRKGLLDNKSSSPFCGGIVAIHNGTTSKESCGGWVCGIIKR